MSPYIFSDIPNDIRTRNCYTILVEDSLYRISVKALIQDQAGQYMVIDTDGKGLELPGGGIDHGENPLEGLAREIMEELGVGIQEAGKMPVALVTDQATSGKREGMWVLWMVYEVRLRSEIALTDEQDSRSYKYVDMKSFDIQKAHPNERALFAHLQKLGI